MPKITGKIHLKNMEFHGFHGCHPGEDRAGQRFLVDLVLALDLAPAAFSDRLSSTVDYERAHSICSRIVERGRTRLLETLCRRIGEAVLREWPQVSEVGVTVKKPAAPIRGTLEYVAIEASLSRGSRVSRARK